MMSETEIILRQNDIIRRLTSIVDELYLALAQHIGTEAADLPCIEEIQEIDREIEEVTGY